MKRMIMVLLVCLLIVSVTGCKGANTDVGTSTTSDVDSKTMVSAEVITDAMLSFRYPAGAFSIPLKDLLPKCCPDYKGTFAPYEELKNEKLTEEDIQKYETSNIKDYLDNAYFVTLTGCIMENPEIPYLVTENQEILTLLILFDDKDEVVGHLIIEKCRQIDTCAILIATSY